MNLKIVKSLLLFVLFCSAIFASAMISANLYAVHAMTGYIHHENSATLIHFSSPVGGGYAPCGGDPVGGGHPMINPTV